MADSFNNEIEGLHYPVAVSGQLINISVTNQNKVNLASVADRLDLSLFIPAQDFEISQFSIYVSTGVASANTRILIYSDNNNLPDTKLLESSNLDSSAIAQVSYTETFNFIKGQKYWVGTHASSTATLHAISVTGCLPISTNATALNNNSVYRKSVTFGSAPSTFSGGVATNAHHSQVMMLIA